MKTNTKLLLPVLALCLFLSACAKKTGAPQRRDTRDKTRDRSRDKVPMSMNVMDIRQYPIA